jgi:5-formyltetrahydrofolate cyclo-ligase
MLKAELRKNIQKRKALSSDEAFLLSEKILKISSVIFSQKNWKKYIFSFRFLQKEIDTQIFIRYFLSHNIRVFVPKIAEDKLINIEIF